MASTGRLLALFFLLSAGFSINACHDDIVPFELVFTNNEVVSKVFTVDKSGSASSFTDLVPRVFELSPGESQRITGFANIKKTPEGVYSLNVKVNSGFANFLSEDFNFEVSSCRRVSLSSEPVNSCVNQEVVIPLRVSNVGNFVENVTLSSSKGVLSSSSLVLNSGDYQLINLIVTPDSVGSFPVVVSAVFSDGVASHSVIIESVDCVFFNASLTNNYFNLCENSEASASLIINNLYDSSVLFFIESIVGLPDSVRIPAKGSASLDFKVITGCASGVTESLIKVAPEGGRPLSIPLIVNSRSCFQPVITSLVSNDRACSCERLSYAFRLYNPGDKLIEYAVYSNVGNVSEGLVAVNPNSSAELIVDYMVPCDFNGNLNVSLSAVAVDTCVKESNSSVNVRVDSWSVCEAVNLRSPNVMPVNGSPITVPVTIANTGIRPASYKLLISGSGSANLLSISKAFFTLEPGQSDTAELIFDGVDITGNYVNVQAVSLDNLASDSIIVSFGGFGLSNRELFFLIVPLSVFAIFIVRSKFFNKKKD